MLMRMSRALRAPRRRGLIKYFVAWLVGVPLGLLVIIFIIFRVLG